ncbi:MAG: sulfoxide reductase heme-binding subunit YedZ [Gammaproteobacteria bacterium]|nr:sulfoxide reductase heme-binding subunit YedZ [Gammaproteobacteria bacterium]
MRLLKTLVFVVALLPAAKLVLASFAIAGLSLGANPVEELLHEAGEWGLRFLLITLAVTPLRRLTGMNWLIRFRRMLGLFAYFYLVAHFLIYALLDQRLALGPIIEDIIERPYITLGITALTLLTPLALTSTNAMMRRLGSRWQRLHRLIYPAAILGVWHFWWQVKEDIREPLIYAAILAALLGIRVWHRQKGQNRRVATPVD